MSYEPPTPPLELPTDFVNTLNEYSPDQLQHIARYVEKLAEHKDRKTRLEEATDEDQFGGQIDDTPDDVPSKATTTIKEINDNRYYYWQWREGDKLNVTPRTVARGILLSRGQASCFHDVTCRHLSKVIDVHSGHSLHRRRFGPSQP